eukprot:g30151.t1
MGCGDINFGDVAGRVGDEQALAIGSHEDPIRQEWPVDLQLTSAKEILFGNGRRRRQHLESSQAGRIQLHRPGLLWQGLLLSLERTRVGCQGHDVVWQQNKKGGPRARSRALSAPGSSQFGADLLL